MKDAHTRRQSTEYFGRGFSARDGCIVTHKGLNKCDAYVIELSG